MQENSEWDYIDWQLSNEEYGEYAVKFILTVRRRATYYIAVLIIPSFITVAVCLLGIFTPTSTDFNRNEKVNSVHLSIDDSLGNSEHHYTALTRCHTQHYIG
jgi:hypothetical protein